MGFALLQLMNTSNFTSVCLQGVGVMLGFAEENSCSGAASTVPGNVSCAYPLLLSLLCVRQAGLENTWELDVRFGVRIFHQCSPKLTACRQACFSSQNSFWRGNCCQQLCFMLFDLTRLSSGLSIVSSAFCPSKGGLLNPGSRKSVHKLLCFFNVSAVIT